MPLIACLLGLVMALSLSAAVSASRSGPHASAAAKKHSKCLKAKTKKARKKHCRTPAKCARAKTKKARKKHCKAKRRRRATPPQLPLAPPPPRAEGGIDDAVVVAVIDTGVNPYHWDFLASKMPQHQDTVAGNDLPLHRPATEWLPGVASAGFKTFEPLPVKLETNNAQAAIADLHEEASMVVQSSSEQAYNGYWLPHTKVIGAMSFSIAETIDLWEGVEAHGVGTTSSGVGNIHGTCPECLLFFIDSDGQAEVAIEWAEAQPWIDVISNSYGTWNTAPYVYSGTNLEKQRAAAERGQTNVWAAGNGFDGGFAVPNPTTASSQQGPDWNVTVGAIRPGEYNHYGDDDDGASYFGAGKPVDVAGVARSYPNAHSASTVGATGSNGFGGTSNAAPTIAGLFGRSLYLARTALAGPSRAQAADTIAVGAPFPCGPARPACELADGALTGTELRTRLYHGALRTPGGTTGPSGAGSGPAPTEYELASEGHGSFFARQAGPDSDAWLAELERIVGPLMGRAPALERAPEERDWMIVDSYCRQKNWGAWTGGYYVEGATPLPPDDPVWPARSAYKHSCPGGPTGR